MGLGSQRYLLHEVVVAAIVEDGLRRARAILHALHRDLEALPLVLQLRLGLGDSLGLGSGLGLG